MFFRLFCTVACATLMFAAPAHADGATQVITVTAPQPEVVWHSDPLGCGLRVAGPDCGDLWISVGAPGWRCAEADPSGRIAASVSPKEAGAARCTLTRVD